MGDFWAGVGAALLGAVIGGCFTVAGAILVMRRERTRIHRERLYEELIPRLLAHLDTNGIPYIEEEAAAVRRVATLASKKDRRWGEELLLLSVIAHGAYIQWKSGQGGSHDELKPTFAAARAGGRSYSAWLRGKF